MGGLTEDTIIILLLACTCVGVKVGWKSWSVSSPLLRNLLMRVVTQRQMHARRHQKRKAHAHTYHQQAQKCVKGLLALLLADHPRWYLKAKNDDDDDDNDFQLARSFDSLLKSCEVENILSIPQMRKQAWGRLNNLCKIM